MLPLRYSGRRFVYTPVLTKHIYNISILANYVSNILRINTLTYQINDFSLSRSNLVGEINGVMSLSP